jgi:hypothetical protein
MYMVPGWGVSFVLGLNATWIHEYEEIKVSENHIFCIFRGSSDDEDRMSIRNVCTYQRVPFGVTTKENNMDIRQHTLDVKVDLF